MKSMLDKIDQQKNHEYRDSFRWVLSSIVFMLIVCVALVISVSYKSIYPGKTAYYATMTTGEVIPLPSLSEPVVTNKYLLEWASLATRTAFSLNFVDYQKQLDKASTNFTSNGFRAFSAALNSSGLLQTVREKKLMMNAIVSGAPVIIFEGVIAGRHIWRVQLPILVTYGSASDQRQRAMTVTLLISRVPALETAKGILITDFEAK